MATTVTTEAPEAVQGPEIADAFTADHQRFWGSFTKFVTMATVAVVVLLVLMAFFLT